MGLFEDLKELSKNKCKQKRKVEVLRSAAGWYIGTLDEGEPWCRLSEEYYQDKETAEEALENRTFTERESMETMYCNGSCSKCLI